MVRSFSSLRQCTHCDTAVPIDARFCVACGAAADTLPVQQRMPVQSPCPRCRGANPTSAAFCVHCGSAMAEPASASYAPAYQPAVGGAVASSAQYALLYSSRPPIPLIVRALWFVFVGLWLGQLWLITGWLLNLSILGLPVGVWMLNRTGHVMTLRQMPANQPIDLGRSSVSLAVRTIYFVLIGWWASLIWLMFGWLAAATVIGLPVAFLMFEYTGTVATLADA